jgi:trimeric autotransporter adhesin
MLNKKMLFITLALMAVGLLMVGANVSAATTVGVNITTGGNISAAGTLTVATTTPYNGFIGLTGDINQLGNYKIYQNYLPVFVASSTNYSLSVGTEAGKNLTDGGQYNTFMGYQAGYTATSSDYNIGIGYQSLYSVVNSDSSAGKYNTGIGYQSLYANTTGYDNYAIGYNTLSSNTTGNNNIALGDSALSSNTTGIRNIAIGRQSVYLNTTGQYNIGIGYQALQVTGTGSSNIAIGTTAGLLISGGSWNTIVGSVALMGGTDSFANSVFGYGAGSANSFSSSTFMGYQAGKSVTGSGNILLGYNAGDAITSGANNIVIGYDIDAPSNTTSNQLNIGNILFGDGLVGTGTTIRGRLGVASSTPWRNNAWDYSFVVATTTMITGTTTIGTSNTLVVNPNESRVGIGTATPKAALDVAGSTILGSTAPAANATTTLTFGSSSTANTKGLCLKFFTGGNTYYCYVGLSGATPSFICSTNSCE